MREIIDGRCLDGDRWLAIMAMTLVESGVGVQRECGDANPLKGLDQKFKNSTRAHYLFMLI